MALRGPKKGAVDHIELVLKAKARDQAAGSPEALPVAAPVTEEKKRKKA